MKRLLILALFALPASLWAEDSNPARIVTDVDGNRVPRSRINSWHQVGKVMTRIEPAAAKRGQTVTIRVEVQPVATFWTYPTVQTEADNSFKNVLGVSSKSDLISVGAIKDPPGAKTKEIPELSLLDHHYYPGPNPVIFELKAVVSPDAALGEKTVGLRGQVSICDDVGCLNTNPPDLEAKITILDGEVEIEPQYRDEVQKKLASRATSVKKDEPKKADPNRGTPNAVPLENEVHAGGYLIPKGADYAKSLETVLSQLPPPETSDAGFVAFLLTAMFWGAVTLLTPCVFPMIPITVSFFIKQGEKKVHNPVVMASVYTLTIVLVLGLSSITLLSTFQDLSVSPVTNVALGLLFVLFALSLFGMFDIRLPGFLAKYTSGREDQGGYLGVIFMAFSFTIVSFTCVAPFLGGFSGMAASGNFSKVQLAMGGLAFAGTFAAPFFLLALFPSLMKRLPKSGDWMNTVKVVMGFLEVAAALKFFRTAELGWTIPPQIFTYDFVLSMWVVLLVFCGLYLLNLYRLPHDYPQDNIGVTRMLFGVLTFTLAIYFLPALFAKAPDGTKQRPAGIVYAWVDAFLLPEPSAAEVLNKGGVAWSGDLLRSVEDARAKGKYVFVDFTGVTCTNCKLNEKNVFVKENVKELFQKYHLVQLYTDWVPEPFYESPPDREDRENHASAVKKFQQKGFGTSQLPLYVILKPLPDGKIERVGVYAEGKINDEAGFVAFLKKPFEGK
jgi:thiol:disulfide interchange protein